MSFAKSFAKSFVITFAAFIGILMLGSVFEEDAYGPVVGIQHVTSPLNDGLDCAEFTHQQGQVQLICFESKEVSLFGLFHYMDTVPAYYIEDGVFTPLFM